MPYERKHIFNSTYYKLGAGTDTNVSRSEAPDTMPKPSSLQTALIDIANERRKDNGTVIDDILALGEAAISLYRKIT